MTDNDTTHTHTCVEVGRLNGEIQALRRDNTAYANEVAELKAKLAAGRNWFPARKRDEPARRCNVEGCTDKHAARGYCVKHHARFKRTGDPLGVKPGSHEARLKDNVCGTLAGYSRHRKRGERPCDACARGNAAYQRERRERLRLERLAEGEATR